jgi:hypothetical protein
MIASLLTFVMMAVIFALAGFVVGLGVLLVQDFPKVGEFLKQRPVLGWTAAFTVGGSILMLLIALFDFAVLLLLSFVR